MHTVRKVHFILSYVPLSSFTENAENKLRKSETTKTKLHGFGLQKANVHVALFLPFPSAEGAG